MFPALMTTLCSPVDKSRIIW